MKKLLGILLGTAMSLSSQPADAQKKQTTFSYGSHTYTMEGTLTADAYDAKATGKVSVMFVKAARDSAWLEPGASRGSRCVR